MSKHPVMHILKKQFHALAELEEEWKRILVYETFKIWQIKIFLRGKTAKEKSPSKNPWLVLNKSLPRIYW